jgi:hypothetical protein
MRKKIASTHYMESKISWRRNELIVECDPQGYLYSKGKYRTKILPADLPEWYVYGYIYKRHGYIPAKGVKHLLYIPNYMIENHLFKYDTLYISYDAEITSYTTDVSTVTWYKDYEHAIGGSLVPTFVDAVGKHSDYDVGGIRGEIEKKRAWYCERNSK